MADKRMLIVPGEVVKKIDENRGDLSQADFLSFLMENSLDGDSADGESVAARFVTRDTFQEFAQGMKDLMRNFLDFFISYGLELGQRPGGDEMEALSQRLQHLGTASGAGYQKDAKG
jgi:hypothetical protein